MPNRLIHGENLDRVDSDPGLDHLRMNVVNLDCSLCAEKNGSQNIDAFLYCVDGNPESTGRTG